MTVVAILGASGALGSKIAREAAHRKHRPIWLIDRDPSVDAIAASLPESAAARSRTVDITSPVDMAKLEMEWLAGEGPTLVVNAVGTRHVAALDVTTDEQWEDTIDVNLTGAFRVVRTAAKAMRHHGSEGVIINVVSIASEIAFRERAAYCAAKAGVLGLTRAAALDLAPHGIRVLAVSPGLYAAGISDQVDDDQMRAQVPLGRAGDPTDLAVLVLDIAKNQFLTGTNIVVDGGSSAGRS